LSIGVAIVARVIPKAYRLKKQSPLTLKCTVIVASHLPPITPDYTANAQAIGVMNLMVGNVFTKSGLQQATKGYDIKQVVDALKAAGWLMLDNEGKSATRANFKNNETNENRFYVLCLTNTLSTTDTTQVPDKGRL
jgi:hypothetical protein